MKLYLVQHGEAVSKAVDPDRPLTNQGRRDAKKIAHFMRSTNIVVQRVLHSGKIRARQSADILAAAVLLHGSPAEIIGINPNDSVAEFAGMLSEMGSELMIVGHMPFMAKLVSYLLISDDLTPLVAYRPGCVVCLEYTQENGWILNWMLRPELLIDLTE